MDCDPLARTGLDANLPLILLLAAACLLGGALLLLAIGGRRRAGVLGVLVVLLVGAGLTLAPAPPAEAGSFDCATLERSLAVTQTIASEQLAPGSEAVRISGRIVNNSIESTRIAAVTVEIASVTADPAAPDGACNASDYVIFNSWMPVDRLLGPGESTTFAGAAVGFTNKVTNQDACQHATVHLLYTANPTSPPVLDAPGR